MADRFAFIAEWLDPNTGVLWKYQLFYYPQTSEIEMVSGLGAGGGGSHARATRASAC